MALKDFLPALLLPAVVLLVSALVWLEGRNPRHARARQRLKTDWHAWRLGRFGLPFEQDAFGHRPPSAHGLGELKSHRLLQEKAGFATPNKDMPHYVLRITAILHDEARRHWLVIFHSSLPAGKAADDAPIERQPPAVLPISELRARRALFNDPAAYTLAFGEAPTWQGLAAWRKRHPEQEPPPDSAW